MVHPQHAPPHPHMVSGFLFPAPLAAAFDPRFSYALWPLRWGAAPPWRPLGYIWWMRGNRRWGATLQGEDGGYYVVRVEQTGEDVAVVYIERRVMLRLEFVDVCVPGRRSPP